MSDFQSNEVVTINNGIMNGASLVDGSVPNLSGISHNEIISVDSTETPKNVNGGTYDPYCRIQKTALFNLDGYPSKKSNVKVERSPDEFLEAGIVGDNYLLVKNREVSDVCTEIRNESGMNWEHDRIFFDGKRFRNVYKTRQFSKELSNGDVAFLMFTEMNSYDGSTKAGFRIDFMILVCQNGMVSPKYGWDSRFRHSLGNVNWQEQIRAGALALTGQRKDIKMEQFAEACNTLHNPLDMSKLASIRQNHIHKLPNLRYGEIMTKYHDEDGSSIWDLMQAGTSTLWHRDKMTNADFNNNALFVDGLLDFGKSQNLS
jgi:hypothetical protein|tara:strand:+ start:357 stop:1304 length:948 start_codon:yes stop_codon:yes gene_type:complete